MLFVYYDKTKSMKREKDGTSRTKDNIVRIGGKLFLPYFHTFSIAILTMINTQPIAKYGFQSFCYLHSKGYFWKKIEHLLMLIDGFLD